MLVIADVAGKSVRRRIADGHHASEPAHGRRRGCAAGLLGATVSIVMRARTAWMDADSRPPVLGQYEHGTGTLTYVNAGHNAPVLRRANGTLEELDKGGLPLGIESDAPYETGQTCLRSGDVLIFLHRWLHRSVQCRRRRVRKRAVARGDPLLPNGAAQESLHYLMRQVDQFVGATRQADDITCMISAARELNDEAHRFSILALETQGLAKRDIRSILE